MNKLLSCMASCLFIFTATAAYSAGNTSYGSAEIKVGSCELKVYTAMTYEQKRNGMLGFTDKTFDKEGMIFIGSRQRMHYYHTEGMSMKIRIMGVDRVGTNAYKVNGDARYAPEGLKTVEVYGESVFEVPEQLYQERLKDCLFK